MQCSARKRHLGRGKTARVEEGVLAAVCLQMRVRTPGDAETTPDSSDTAASLEYESYMPGDYQLF